MSKVTKHDFPVIHYECENNIGKYCIFLWEFEIHNTVILTCQWYLWKFNCCIFLKECIQNNVRIQHTLRHSQITLLNYWFYDRHFKYRGCLPHVYLTIFKSLGWCYIKKLHIRKIIIKLTQVHFIKWKAIDEAVQNTHPEKCLF